MTKVIEYLINNSFYIVSIWSILTFIGIAFWCKFMIGIQEREKKMEKPFLPRNKKKCIPEQTLQEIKEKYKKIRKGEK